MSKINLLPWREEKRKGLNQLFFFILGGAVFFSLMLIILLNAYCNYKIAVGNANISYMENEIKGANVEVAEVQKLQEDKKQLVERMRVIQLLQTDRMSIVNLIDKIPHILPATVYLTVLSRKEGTEEALKEFNPMEFEKRGATVAADKTANVIAPLQKQYLIILEGISMTNAGISEFLKNLEAVQDLSHVKLNEVSINAEGEGLSFKIECLQNLGDVE